ncbi:hypothetical protein [Streptomyces sp. NPDC056949]|uniref:hypothetical protein n=1 Tax=Streptomyces sp. NPDC056949 TaxID=3345976 RepID=UPI00363D4E39
MPVNDDGSAGTPKVIAKVNGPDGVRAYKGQVYVATEVHNTVIRLSPTGKVDRARRCCGRPRHPGQPGDSEDAARGAEALVTNSSIFPDDAGKPGVVSINLR